MVDIWSLVEAWAQVPWQSRGDILAWGVVVQIPRGRVVPGFCLIC